MNKFFTKIWGKVQEFWYFTVKNSLQKRIIRGGFKIDFRQYDMRIETLSKNFSMKLRASEHSFGYLVSSIAAGKEENIHGFAAFMYFIAVNLCRDDMFRRDLQDAIAAYERREQVKAKIDEADGDEEVAMLLIKQDLERAGMKRPERRRAERAFQKAAKEILKEDKDNEQK